MDATFRDPVFLSAAALVIALEWIWRRMAARQPYDAAAARASFAVAFGRGLSSILTLAALTPIYAALWRAAPVKLPADDWRVWIAAFFAVEFAYYWMHRCSHRVRWMWASHTVHHSAEELTLPAALRLGWTDLLSGNWVFFTPLILIGFHPLLVVAILAANLKFQFLLHTETIGKLGPLEGVFNTPSSHRVHHATNDVYIDKNFGGVLTIFDRLFGTYEAERDDIPCRYGLSPSLGSNNPFVIAFHGWAALAFEAMRARTPRELASALFGRP
jgi:sterol desaturase/sphingolipid hydroxylase (fatty acid hydroxylase superfamily)